MSNMETVKIVKIPASKMVKTPEFHPGDETFFSIMKKFWTQVVDRHIDIFPRDFMPFNDDTGESFWLYSVLNIDISKFDTEGFEIIDFEGGLYATATTIDPDVENSDFEKAIEEVKDWIAKSKNFELDFRQGRHFMSQRPITDDDEFEKAMGYYQNEIYIPIKIKKQKV